MSASLSTGDLAVDHTLAQIGESFRFLLDVTPTDADHIRDDFLAGAKHEPEFTYRELDADPDVIETMLEGIDLDAIEDPTVGHLLRAKHRELKLQVEMLRARCTEDFRPLSIELYGGVAPALRDQAQAVLDSVPAETGNAPALTDEEFLELALAEIVRYRHIDADVGIHAEIRDDIVGVLVQQDTLLIGRGTAVAAGRANALIQHEIGTHLITQVNGSAQPLRVLGTGLAGYDETQEGLAVLAEIAVGGLTPNRLRQLASRVLTVHRMVGGATFVECFDELVASGVPAKSAFTTTMRVHRSGGLTKDAVYLRGLVDLLAHVAADGDLSLLWRGKFALVDLPLIQDLESRDLLEPARLRPRYLDGEAMSRIIAAASADLPSLVKAEK